MSVAYALLQQVSSIRIEHIQLRLILTAIILSLYQWRSCIPQYVSHRYNLCWLWDIVAIPPPIKQLSNPLRVHHVGLLCKIIEPSSSRGFVLNPPPPPSLSRDSPIKIWGKLVQGLLINYGTYKQTDYNIVYINDTGGGGGGIF